ncbi:MAG: hypothetical protein JNL01_02265 [Bdellovibrionales bacterium]|nr:hypothetical protein [Bdellovibrionales bacterium]
MQIITITERAEDIAFGTQVAEKLGLLHVNVDSAPELKRILTEGLPNPDGSKGKVKLDPVFLWDIDHKEAINVGHPLSIGRIGNELQNFGRSNRVILVSSQALNKTPFMFNLNVFSHHIARSPEDSRAIEFFTRIFPAINKPKGFTFAQILPPGAMVEKWKLTQSTDRTTALDKVQQFLSATKMNPQLATLVVQGTDELLMNAIFDAPMQGGGQYYRRKTPRNSAFPLNAKEGVDVAIGQTDDVFLISVTDHFGSVKKTSLFGSIRRDYEKTDYTPPDQDLGAGLGVYGMMQSGMSLAFIVDPMIQTEVILMVPKEKSMKEFRSTFRFFYMLGV